MSIQLSYGESKTITMPLRLNARCLRSVFFVGMDYQNRGALIGVSYARNAIEFIYNDGDVYSSDSNDGVIITKQNAYSLDITITNKITEGGVGKDIVLDIYYS